MWLISLVAVVICSYFLARMTVNFVAMQFEAGGTVVVTGDASSSIPVAEESLLLEDYKPLIERNIFDSKYSPASAAALAAGTGEDAVEENPTGEAVPTTLKAKLISTFVVGDGTDERSSAIISSGGKNGEEVYTVNDKTKNSLDIKVVVVQFRRVEFVNKGRLEFIELDDFSKGVDLNKPPEKAATEAPTRVVKESSDGEEPKIEAVGETKFIIDRAEIDAALGSLDKLYTQIRAVPHFKDGKASGLKLLSVRGDSIFAKLGLKRGDVLQKINGMELDIKKGLELFNQLKTESKISMEIERRDAPVTLEYEIR